MLGSVGRLMTPYLSSGVPPEAQDIIDAMVPVPDLDRQALIIDTVTSLLPVWDALGLLAMFAAHSNQPSLLNWKDPSGTPLLAAGTPVAVFTTDRGYSSDATQSYVSTQKAWNTIPGVAQNGAHVGGYFHFGGANGANATGLVGGTAIQIARAASNLSTRVNTGTTTTANAVPSSAGTHLCAVRDGATSERRYIDGVAGTVGTSTSATIVTSVLSGLRFNASFAPVTTSIRAIHAGGVLTESEELLVYTAIQTYMVAVGAN